MKRTERNGILYVDEIQGSGQIQRITAKNQTGYPYLGILVITKHDSSPHLFPCAKWKFSHILHLVIPKPMVERQLRSLLQLLLLYSTCFLCQKLRLPVRIMPSIYS